MGPRKNRLRNGRKQTAAQTKRRPQNLRPPFEQRTASGLLRGRSRGVGSRSGSLGLVVVVLLLLRGRGSFSSRGGRGSGNGRSGRGSSGSVGGEDLASSQQGARNQQGGKQLGLHCDLLGDVTCRRSFRGAVRIGAASIIGID